MAANLEGVMEQAYPQITGNLAMAQDYREEPQPQPPRPQAPLRMLPSLPPAPEHLNELGLPERFIEDLTLKMLYRIANPTPVGLASALRVSPTIAREVAPGGGDARRAK